MKTHTICARVATKVASRWRHRGIRSSSFEEMYQDAYLKALHALPKFDPEVGELEGFLYVCANNYVHDEATRRAHPVSSRSNALLGNMGRTVIGVVHDASNDSPDDVDYDHLVYLTQVRKRMEAIAKRRADGSTALACAMGYTTVAEAAPTKEARKALYRSIRELKADMLNDMTLYKMARDYNA